MQTLHVRDVRRLLEFVSELREQPIGLATLERLRDLIPCLDATYFDTSSGATVASSDVLFPSSVVEAIDAFGGQRPSAVSRVTAQDGAVRLSALVTRRELREGEFFQHVMRPMDMEDELMIRFAGPAAAGVSVIADRTFSERDRIVLDVLGPHLARAHARAARDGLRSPLTAREREILGLVRSGKANKEIAELLGVTSHTVRKHLEHTYEKLGVHTRTAAVARAFDSR